MTNQNFLFDIDGEPLSLLRERIFSIVTYPFDNISRDQLLTLMADEQLRRESSNSEYSSSAFSDSVATQIVLKCLSQRAIAGLVTIVFFVAALNGRKDLTQYRATQIVESLLKKIPDEPHRPIFVNRYLPGGVVEKVTLRAVSSRVDIEKRFRTYSLVGPLVASMYSAVVMLGQTKNATENEKVRDALRLAAYIEQTVVDTFPQYFSKSIGLVERLSPGFSSINIWLEFLEIGKFIRESL